MWARVSKAWPLSTMASVSRKYSLTAPGKSPAARSGNWLASTISPSMRMQWIDPSTWSRGPEARTSVVSAGYQWGALRATRPGGRGGEMVYRMARRGVGGAWDFLCGGRPAARDWALHRPAGQLPGLVDGVDAVARQECDARDRPPPGRDRGRSRTVSPGHRVERVGLGAGRPRAGLGGARRRPTRDRPLRLRRV